MYELTTRARVAETLNLHEVKITLTEANWWIESTKRKYLAAIKLEKLVSDLGYSVLDSTFSEILKLLNDNGTTEQPNASELEDFKKMTGWDTPAEMAAYEKGREHEQAVLIKFIQAWDGETNSEIGKILSDKFTQQSF